MSGHSKWSQIKRQKGAADTKRGQLFTKLGREISVAARSGGPDPEANPRLRLAVQRAREANMPAETVERAIKRAAGGAEGAAIEEAVYEGYGPGGAAILAEVTTDNRNRAVSEVRSVLTRGGGSLGATGCVAWLFEPRAVVTVQVPQGDPEEVALIALDAGAEDVSVEGNSVDVYGKPGDLDFIRGALQAKNLTIVSAENAMVPNSTVTLDLKDAIATLKVMEKLEDLEDVQRVYTNLNITDEVLREFEGRSA